jgi:tripartite ATP-independent transporter DctM subunit
LAAVVILLGLRVPIGLTLGLVSLVGIAEIRGIPVMFAMIRTAPFDMAAHWSLSSIPMFLLMGSIAYHSGISAALFRAARTWLGGLPGGLAVAANFACAGFAAASGVSIATAAAMGRIIIPEMLRHGYDKGLATGVVASAGTLGVLIPPSILMVVYGVFAEVSVSKLFIAGILPGILTATVYAAMIVTRCIFNPALAPQLEQKIDWGERFRSLRDVWPLIVLIVGIIGGLYLGFVTATEAGAVGALLALVIAVVQKRMSVETFRASVLEALSTTARIFFVIIGAVLLTRFMALSGVPAHLSQQIGSWGADPLLLVLAASLIYLLLGMFLDPIGLMLLTLPLFLPLFEALNLDLIWFGILVIKYLEIGLITPPVGMNVYVIKSVVGDTVELETIFKGVAWFVVCEVIVVGLLVAFPGISLYLPSLMD